MNWQVFTSALPFCLSSPVPGAFPLIESSLGRERPIANPYASKSPLEVPPDPLLSNSQDFRMLKVSSTPMKSRVKFRPVLVAVKRPISCRSESWRYAGREDSTTGRPS
jgi:hypothetical protein